MLDFSVFPQPQTQKKKIKNTQKLKKKNEFDMIYDSDYFSCHFCNSKHEVRRNLWCHLDYIIGNFTFFFLEKENIIQQKKIFIQPFNYTVETYSLPSKLYKNDFSQANIYHQPIRMM